MPYSFSIWLDDDTAEALARLARADERKRSDMVKVLIRRAARDLPTDAPGASEPPPPAQLTQPEAANAHAA